MKCESTQVNSHTWHTKSLAQPCQQWGFIMCTCSSKEKRIMNKHKLDKNSSIWGSSFDVEFGSITWLDSFAFMAHSLSRTTYTMCGRCEGVVCMDCNPHTWILNFLFCKDTKVHTWTLRCAVFANSRPPRPALAISQRTGVPQVAAAPAAALRSSRLIFRFSSSSSVPQLLTPLWGSLLSVYWRCVEPRKFSSSKSKTQKKTKKQIRWRITPLCKRRANLRSLEDSALRKHIR